VLPLWQSAAAAAALVHLIMAAVPVALSLIETT
jgi:hypothetical protein